MAKNNISQNKNTRRFREPEEVKDAGRDYEEGSRTYNEGVAAVNDAMDSFKVFLNTKDFDFFDDFAYHCERAMESFHTSFKKYGIFQGSVEHDKVKRYYEDKVKKYNPIKIKYENAKLEQARKKKKKFFIFG